MENYDIIVVGAGLIGLSTAYRAQKAGAKVMKLPIESVPSMAVPAISVSRCKSDACPTRLRASDRN